MVRYWAQDVAGNYHYSKYFEVGIDTSPPTAWARLSQSEADHSALATWGGSDLHSGLAGYRVEIRRGEGDWENLLPDGEGETTETALAISVGEEETVEIRVRAVDRVGHTSDWAVAGLETTIQLFLPTVVGGQ